MFCFKYKNVILQSSPVGNSYKDRITPLPHHHHHAYWERCTILQKSLEQILSSYVNCFFCFCLVFMYKWECSLEWDCSKLFYCNYLLFATTPNIFVHSRYFLVMGRLLYLHIFHNHLVLFCILFL